MNSHSQSSLADSGQNFKDERPGKRKAALRALIILLSYTLMAVVMTWPMVKEISNRTPLSMNSIAGIYFQAEQSLLFFKEYPFQFYQAFNPSVMQPMPYLFLKSSTSFAVIFIFGPIYLLTNNLYLAINVLVLIFLIATAYCTYLLGRYWLGNWRAGYLAGAFMAFGAMNIYWMADYAFINFALFSISVLCFERFALENRPKYLFGTTLFLIIQFYVLPHHFLLVGYFLVALAVLRRKNILKRRNLAPFAACAIIGFIAIAPIMIPYIKNLRAYNLRDLSWFGLTPTFGWTSIYLGEWLNPSRNNPLYGIFNQGYDRDGIGMNGELFPGILIIGLAIYGFRKSAGAKIPAKFLLGTILTCLILVTALWPFSFFRKPIGSFAVVSLLLNLTVPFMWILRDINRVISLLALCLSMLAGIGYVRMEKALSGYIYGWRKLALIAAAVLVMSLENLTAPLTTYDYDLVFGPTQGTRYVKENNLPAKDDEYIMWLPAYDQYTQKPDALRFWNVYERQWSTGFSHIYHRHPSVCTYVSYVPSGWIGYLPLTFPSVQAQKYLRALGVTVIVVHGMIVEPPDADKFSVANLVKMGLKLVKSFPDGDAVYSLTREIQITKNLFLAPDYQKDKLELLAVTPEYYGKVIRDQQKLKIEDSVYFWRNPDLCRVNKMKIVIQDAEGKTRTKKLKYQLPLIVGATRNVAAVWDLKKDKIKGPVKLVSVSCKQIYLIQPPEMFGKWRLESE